jgi:hypothetical protein
MTIASKSGGLILKSGSLATTCACCGPDLCSCLSGGSLPSELFVQFSDFVFPPPEFPFQEPQRAFAQDFLNSITSPLPLSDPYVYSTGGCTASPCTGCYPTFRSLHAYRFDSSNLEHSIRMFLFCSLGVFAFPRLIFPGGSQSSFGFWRISTPGGCPPPVPGGVSAQFDFRFPSDVSLVDLCEASETAVQGFTLSAPSQFSCEAQVSTTTIAYNRAATAGTISVSLINPLP